MSDQVTHAEPTPAEVSARLRDDLAAYDGRIAAADLADEFLRDLLGWVVSWCYPYRINCHVKLSPDQHAAVRAVATRAIAARGGAFADGIWTWRVGKDGELRAMAALVESSKPR